MTSRKLLKTVSRKIIGKMPRPLEIPARIHRQIAAVWTLMNPEIEPDVPQMLIIQGIHVERTSLEDPQ